MNYYSKIRLLLENEQIQSILTYSVGIGGGIAILLLALLFHDKLSIVAGVAREVLSATKPVPLPTLSPLPIPTDTLTNTPEPTNIVVPIQTYQQPIGQASQSTTIDCVGPDGKHLQITQQQCDSFISAWKPTIQPIQNQQSNNSEPTVTCVLSYGTYQLTQSYCDLYKASDYHSSITAPYVSPVQNTQPTPIPTINNNYALNGQCVTNASTTFNQQKNNCLAQYGMGSSTGPACIQIYKSQYNQAIADCNARYPTN